VPAYSVYKIKKETPFQHAALAEPLSCVGYAIEKLKIQVGDSVCRLGCRQCRCARSAASVR
jgi:threonine dehydrogenase-like Zn-dependent dehydrogenase